MSRREAQEILLSCRPGREPADDPQVAAALELARTDPELRQWYEQHRAWDAAVRKKLNSIPVPHDLKSAILIGPKVITGPAHWWTRRAVLAAAAALIVSLITLAVMILNRPAAPEKTFAAFRSEIISVVLREYRMDLETNDMRQIRAFLGSRGAPADYTVPAGLQKLKLAGCGKRISQGKPVSMVCYEDDQHRFVWLFIAKVANWKDRPSAEASFARVFSCATGNWLEGDTQYVYVIAAETSDSSLRKLL
jgi:uncharacterized membrane protein YbaN (DUF454 family)